MQFTYDFTHRTQLRGQATLQRDLWLDVSDIARGVGFTGPVQMGIALDAALKLHQDQMNSGYDQRLYDCLWLAHLKLSLDQSQSATFNFTFPRKDSKTEEASEVSLRVRVEAQKQIVLLGLLKDF